MSFLGTELYFLRFANVHESPPAVSVPFDGATETSWIGKHYQVVDEEGYFTRIDDTRSPVVHQFDRFGARGSRYLNDWIKKAGLWWDPVPAGDSLSACLLWKDENHLLGEWISYHFYALQLRHLVIAVHPLSKTSPQEILDEWRPRMWIQEWEDQNYINNRKHQQNFHANCTRYLWEQNRTWVAYIDANEHLAISKDAVEDTLQFFSQPGSVLRAFQSSTIQETSCPSIPRVHYGSAEGWVDDGHTHSGVNASALNTLQRWRKHSRKRGSRGKVLMLDVSRANPEIFEGDSKRFSLRSVCSRGQGRARQSSANAIEVHQYSRDWGTFSCQDNTQSKSWLWKGRPDERVYPWIKGFTQFVGQDVAETLLKVPDELLCRTIHSSSVLALLLVAVAVAMVLLRTWKSVRGSDSCGCNK